jgi:hypothetical protein
MSGLTPPLSPYDFTGTTIFYLYLYSTGRNLDNSHPGNQNLLVQKFLHVNRRVAYCQQRDMFRRSVARDITYPLNNYKFQGHIFKTGTLKPTYACQKAKFESICFTITQLCLFRTLSSYLFCSPNLYGLKGEFLVMGIEENVQEFCDVIKSQ